MKPRTGAGPSQAGPQAMCLRLNAASIAVPSGDRPGLSAFSGARLGEGLQFHFHCQIKSSALSSPLCARSVKRWATR